MLLLIIRTIYSGLTNSDLVEWCWQRAVVGKDVEAKPGERVVLSEEGKLWCQAQYPDWYSDCAGTITRVDKDGKMCDVKWDDRDRPCKSSRPRHLACLFWMSWMRC